MIYSSNRESIANSLGFIEKKNLKTLNKMSVSILHFSFVFRWRKALDQSKVEQLFGCFQYLHVCSLKRLYNKEGMVYQNLSSVDDM